MKKQAGNMAKTFKVETNLSPDEKKGLDKLVKIDDRTIDSYVRKLIRNAISRAKSRNKTPGGSDGKPKRQL